MNTEAAKDTGGGLNASELAASLTVKDLDTSTTWYHDILGFSIDRRAARGGCVCSLSHGARR